jgi:hypothetical protein
LAVEDLPHLLRIPHDKQIKGRRPPGQTPAVARRSKQES